MTRRMAMRLALTGGVVVAAVVIALVVTISATSAPELLPPPLPTATAGPIAAPNDQAGADAANNSGTAALSYGNAAQPHVPNPPCGPHGRWLIDVNPQDVIGHPYAPMPNARDWDRAMRIIQRAYSICSAGITLTWVGHDAAHPLSDRWTAPLSSSATAALDGPSLRRYALRHAHQV